MWTLNRSLEIISTSSENRSLDCKSVAGPYRKKIETVWFLQIRFRRLKEGRHSITVSVVCSLLTSVFIYTILEGSNYNVIENNVFTQICVKTYVYLVTAVIPLTMPTILRRCGRLCHASCLLFKHLHPKRGNISWPDDSV